MGSDRDGVKPASGTSIEISFQYKGVRCRERIKLKPTPANLKRVELHRAAILDAIARGTFDYAVTFPKSKNAAKFAPAISTDTLGSWMADWLARKEKQLKSSTISGYRKIIEPHIVPRFGEVRLADLNRRDLRTWLESMDVTNKTLRNIQSCLRSALKDAVDDGMIEFNPMAGWSYSRKEAPAVDDDIDPFDADEQAAILAALEGQNRNYVQFALWTGLRPSEQVALRWSDIDWIKGEVRISRALTQASDEPETTKTKAGRRSVKLLGPALDALKAQKAFTLLAGEEIFHNPRTNAGWTGDQPLRKTMWMPALKRSGVRYRYPYQTRHTYASMMLSAGEHPMWVAEQMGHRDWTMIAKVYGRWMPTANPNAGSKAEQVFAPKADGDSTTFGQHFKK